VQFFPLVWQCLMFKNAHFISLDEEYRHKNVSDKSVVTGQACISCIQRVVYVMKSVNIAVFRAELQILVRSPVMLVALIYYRNRIRRTCRDLDGFAVLFIRRYYLFL
jgi:hypothetical protein